MPERKCGRKASLPRTQRDRDQGCKYEVRMMSSVDAPVSAASVANAFLDIETQDSGQFPLIDQMKLQKLLYYAHAWWLASTGHALFDDDVEAWPWGPVIRDVYLEFKDFGRKPIGDKRATELVKVGEGHLDYKIVRPATVPDYVMNHLRNVWDTHKSMSGVQLSNATHALGEPWTIVRDQYGNLDGKPRIPNDLIRDVFRSKLDAPEAAAG